MFVYSCPLLYHNLIMYFEIDLLVKPKNYKPLQYTANEFCIFVFTLQIR